MRTPSRLPGRTWIITPSLAIDLFVKAQSCGASVSMVDLEDSIALSRKQEARTVIPQFFDLKPASECLLGVRINSPVTCDGARDLVALAELSCKPSVVLVPKVESDRDVEMVAGVLDAEGYRPYIYALIETPRAICRLESIVEADRLSGVIFGSADYAAAVGCQREWNALLYARCVLVNSASAAGLPAIDSPYFDLQDTDGLKREAELARQLGFLGKVAIHPKQVPVIDEAFVPTEQELAAARAIIAATDQESDAPITTLDGQMVGPPMAAAARGLVARADDTAY